MHNIEGWNAQGRLFAHRARLYLVEGQEGESSELLLLEELNGLLRNAVVLNDDVVVVPAEGNLNCQSVLLVGNAYQLPEGAVEARDVVPLQELHRAVSPNLPLGLGLYHLLPCPGQLTLDLLQSPRLFLKLLLRLPEPCLRLRELPLDLAKLGALLLERLLRPPNAGLQANFLRVVLGDFSFGALYLLLELLYIRLAGVKLSLCLLKLGNDLIKVLLRHGEAPVYLAELYNKLVLYDLLLLDLGDELFSPLAPAGYCASALLYLLGDLLQVLFGLGHAPLALLYLLLRVLDVSLGKLDLGFDLAYPPRYLEYAVLALLLEFPLDLGEFLLLGNYLLGDLLKPCLYGRYLRLKLLVAEVALAYEVLKPLYLPQEERDLGLLNPVLQVEVAKRIVALLLELVELGLYLAYEQVNAR